MTCFATCTGICSNSDWLAFVIIGLTLKLEFGFSFFFFFWNCSIVSNISKSGLSLVLGKDRQQWSGYHPCVIASCCGNTNWTWWATMQPHNKLFYSNLYIIQAHTILFFLIILSTKDLFGLFFQWAFSTAFHLKLLCSIPCKLFLQHTRKWHPKRTGYFQLYGPNL